MKSKPSPPTPRNTLWLKKLLLALVVPLVFLGAAEGLLRLAGFQYTPREKKLWKPTIAGFVGTYEFYIQTDFAPPGYLWVSQPNTPFTDRYGFRLPEIPVARQPGKIRVAFLGGSTTHGGFRPYPERAIRILNNALRTNRYEALNVACSSYSTHQSLKAFERWVLPRKPDLVFVYHGWNDVNLAGDGFSDREKDPLLSMDGAARVSLPPALRSLRLIGALGKIAGLADVQWPRQRVSFEEFESNLDTLARQCGQQNMGLCIMIRPEQQKEFFVSQPFEPGSPMEQYARKHFQTGDPWELYRLQAERITAIQREVASRHPHTTVCDGQAFVSSLLARNQAGEFGPHVPVFFSDNIHLPDLPEELLAQQVALTIAPEHATAISNWVQSVEYAMAMAGELLRENAPREAAWFIRQALQRQPTAEQQEQLTALLQKAEADFEFADLFREGRWGGTDAQFDSKIAKLKKCLQARPSDYGVLLQIYRVCIYMERMESAAAAMAAFQPQDAQQRHEWLSYTLQSHLQGQRWGEARKTAEKIVAINPNNQMAQSVLQQIPPGTP